MKLPDRTVLRARLRAEGPQIGRILVAAVVGWLVCVAIDSTILPIYAVVVPLVAMREQPFSAFNVSFDRVLGVIGGVVVGVVAVRLLGPSLLAVVVVLAVGLLAGVTLRIGETLNIQAALSGLLVFASSDPQQYAVTRLWETLVGSVVTVGLSPFLFPPDAAAAYRAQFRAVTKEMAATLADLLVVADTAPAARDELGRIGAAAEQNELKAEGLPAALRNAQRAVRLNPLRRKDLTPLEELAQPTQEVVELARDVHVLVDEVRDLAQRADLRPTWSATGHSLTRSVRPVASVIGDGLGPRAAGPREREALQSAAEALLTWKADDPRPILAVLRRPCVRMVRRLMAVASMPDWPGLTPNEPEPARDSG